MIIFIEFLLSRAAFLGDLISACPKVIVRKREGQEGCPTLLIEISNRSWSHKEQIAIRGWSQLHAMCAFLFAVVVHVVFVALHFCF